MKKSICVFIISVLTVIGCIGQKNPKNSVIISQIKNDKVKTYSGGMKRRINIATALLHKPNVLLMDEPTVGIDPQSRNLIFEVLEKLREEGITIVYTTHCTCHEWYRG